MKFDDVKKHVDNAIEQFLDKNEELLCMDVNERTISSKLAVYLQKQFIGLDVDCEYNRNLYDIKGRPQKKNAKIDNTDKRVFPDIIVHSRNTSKNLLVIEIKKAGVPAADRENDFKRLEAFTNANGTLSYLFGLFIEFSVGNTCVKPPYKRWFRKGKLLKGKAFMDHLKFKKRHLEAKKDEFLEGYGVLEDYCKLEENKGWIVCCELKFATSDNSNAFFDINEGPQLHEDSHILLSLRNDEQTIKEHSELLEWLRG